MSGSRHSGSQTQAGFTFIELIFGVVIIAVVANLLIAHLATTYRSTQAHRERVFAYSTAQSILAELHALSDGAVDPESFDLLSYDDGAVTKPTLTVAMDGGVLVYPDHPNSRNILRRGQWLWSRRVSVRSMPGVVNRNLRYVTVTIFKKDRAGIERPMATLSSVLSSVVEGFPSTQAFDIYLLALESIPGWWVNMEAIQSFVESTISDLESRNPGLDFRTHWITKASYGRNPVYRPYLNVLANTLQDIPQTYFYAGLMPAGGAINYYYAPERFSARIATDAGQINGYDVDRNPYPYAVSDFYNHAMRLPDERALHGLRVAAVKTRKQEIQDALIAGTPPPPELDDMSEEPTLRLFLEDLNTDPDRFRHAIIVNLHGELVPLPALRNYSDPAKLPRVLPDIRVVTHPEQLRTERPTASLPGEDVVLRIYAYTAQPYDYSGPEIMPATHLIALEIPGLDITDDGGPALHPGVEIKNLPGGVMVGGTDEYFPFSAAKVWGDPTLQPDEMCYSAQLIDPGPGLEKKTVIWLYYTPVVAPSTSSRGLENNQRSRLYGLEYVPSCTEAARDFSRDLYTSGSGPKNTARWTIVIPDSVFGGKRFIDNLGTYYNPNADVRLAIRTRIWDISMGDASSSGVMYPEPIDPENLSVTYTWWADSREDVPITERSQFLGDPRHNPYKDLLDGDTDYPNGYNWYHDSLRNNWENSAADYPGLDDTRLANRWNGRIRADVPRLFQLFRGGLVESATVYTSLTGWSYYYAGIGNEMGADSSNGYSKSLPMDLRPYGNPGNTGFINNITKREGNSNTGGRRFISDDSGRWWAMPWLGELYPDQVYVSQWFATDVDGEIRGNLDAGAGGGEFRRMRERDAHSGSPYHAYGTVLHTSEQRCSAQGCTAFFNIGSTSSTFHHQGSNGKTGDLVGAGIELGTAYGIDLPATTEISRPFNLKVGGSTGPEFGLAPYTTERFSAKLIKTYYNHSTGWTGSGLIQLTDPGNTSSGFLVVNGLNPSVDLGTAEIAKYSILSTIHSFFEVGTPILLHRIPQTPMLTIASPTEITELTDPATIDVQFDVEWLRWDGLKYTSLTSPTFMESESLLEYVLMYSRDNGQTWQYLVDDTVATPGIKPTEPTYIEVDGNLGEEVYIWSVPTDRFAEGMYVLRVEVYRNNQNLHHAYHQVRCFIDR